ncbi:nitroreductase [Desulfovibrio sp. OttesenSCG-928-I05]|nr:nitroreductase [Desulfovibrio sp. OttesenSCG-928-I05]
MNTEALKALKERRSIRTFKPEQVREEDLAPVLEAATYAPNGKGQQPCIIIAVQNPDDVNTLRKMNAAVMGTNTDPYYGAPTILLVLCDTSSATPAESGSAVMTYLVTAAHAAGLGTCWIHREKQMFDSPEGKALLKKWGVSGEYVGVAGCALGYIDGEAPKAAPRKENYVIRV